MTQDEIIEMAIQGHASTRDAIRWAMNQEQEQGEPVAYINIEKRSLEWTYEYMSWNTPTVVNLPRIPLYMTPPQRTWVGLTDEERNEILDSNKPSWERHIANMIEAKLKDKNT